MSIVVDLKRLDLTETVQFPVRIGFQLIVSCICATKRDVCIVDPVLLLRAANVLFRAITIHVRTLECLVMRGKRDVIARDHCARCKADLCRCNGRVRRMVDIRRTVIDLRDLCKRTRKILRRNLSCRRKVHASLCIDRRRAVREVIILPRVARDLYIIRDILRRNIAAAARNILVRIVPLYGHLCTIIDTVAVRHAHELVRICRSCRIAHIRLGIAFHEDVMMQFLPVDRSVHEGIAAVIDLVNARRLRNTDIDRTAGNTAIPRDLTRAILERNTIQCIVPDLCGIPCSLHIVEHLRRSRNIRRQIVAAVRKLSALRTETEEHVVLICCDNPCPGAWRRRQPPPSRNLVIRRAIVDLGCICRMSVEINHLEIIRGDVAAVDRALAVYRRVDSIVARRGRPELILERVSHIRILHIMRRTVACIRIRRKGGRATPIGACRRGGRGRHHPLIPRRETRRRDIVHAKNGCKHGACGIIRKTCDRRGGVSRRAVIGLRHGCHRDIQLTRRDLAHIRDVVPCRGDGLAVARAAHGTDDVIACIDDLIVVCVFSRELRRVVDGFLDDSIVAVSLNIFIYIGGTRGILRLSGRIRDQWQRDNLSPGQDIPIAVRMLRHPVVDLLLELLRLRLNLGRGNSPLCDDCVRSGCIDCFEFTFIGARCAEVVIRERADILVMRIRDDIVRDMFRLRFVRGVVRPRRITGKMPVLTRHREIDIVLVLIDDPRIGAGRRRLCDKRLAIFELKGARPVIDLCRIGNPAVLVAYLKVRLFDQAAVDRALAVDGIVDCVVVLLCRGECFLQDIANVLITYVVLRAIARVHILGKGTPRDASEGTMRRSCRQHCRMLYLQRGRRNTIIREDGRSNVVARRRACKPRDVALRIDSSAVIDLVHRPHSDGDGAGRNRACVIFPCAVLRELNTIAGITCGIRVEDVVLRLVARPTLEGNMIGDILRFFCLIRSIPYYVGARIVRRRGVRARRIARDIARDRDEVFSRRECAIAIRLLRPSVVDLRDVAVDDRRRECLRRDRTLARRVEVRALGERRILIVDDPVVIQQMSAIPIGIRIRICVHFIGDLFCRLDILRLRWGQLIRHKRGRRAILQEEFDMPLVAYHDARTVVRRPDVRGEVDVTISRVIQSIGSRSIIDLRRVRYRVVGLMVDLKVAGLDLTADNAAIKVDGIIGYGYLVIVLRCIVELVVLTGRIDAIRAQLDVGVLEFMRALMDLLIACGVRIFWICNVRQSKDIRGPGLIRHDLAAAACGDGLVDRDVPRADRLLHLVVTNDRGAIINAFIRLFLAKTQ